MQRLTPRPLISTGQVRHSRLRPAENTFSYGVFTLMLPLRALGDAGFDNRLCSRNRFNLIAFHDRDHGDGHSALLPWIDSLLHSEGISDADGEIWLQTFPRVLGYVFNPVSFWFCHRRNGELRAIVCEVNNTFGERHCYLLHGPDLDWGREQVAAKVFHVSPFCRVEGRYRFRFMRQDTNIVSCVDHDDDAGPLLLTSLSGRLEPLTSRAARHAFFAMPALTLMIVARIHWQALKLALKRVPFFSKPQPPERFVTR